MTIPCKPVFIVGMNGSGTSMMLDSLGRHPDLFAVPHETLMMPYIIARAGQFGDLADDRNFRALWQFALEEMPVLRRMNHGARPSLPEDWRTWPRTVAGVFDGIFSGLAGRQGKTRWCEKTPDHVQHLELLAETFPLARFVHLVRDGREVARSLHRRQFRQPELVMYRWKMLVRMGQAQGAKLGPRYLELKYEDLTCDPAAQMRRVCEYLDLEFSESVLVSRMPQSQERRSLPSGELGQIRQNPVKWPDFFDEAAVRRLETIGGRLLRELSYPVLYRAGDTDPPAALRRFWRASDYARLTLRRIRRRHGVRSLKDVAQTLSFSFKQYRSKHY